MAGLTINDEGTLVLSDYGNEVFFAQSPNSQAWACTLTDKSWSWDVGFPPGSPSGRETRSATKFWQFSISDDGTLQWDEVIIRRSSINPWILWHTTVNR